MEGYSYQSVAVVTDVDGGPVFAMPDVESAAVMAACVGDGSNVRVIPVAQLPWFPAQQPVAAADGEEVRDGER